MMAFTPIVWPLAVVLGIGVLVLRRGDITAYGLRFVAAVGTPVLVLAPWSLTLLTNPSALLTEAGLDIGTGTASGLDLLGISPGGPGAAGGILLLGIVLAALAALLREERQFAVRTAWAVALVGFLFAAVANGSTWAGPATLVYGAALIAAALVGADGARIRVAEQSFGWRQPVAALIALAAGAAPVLAAFGWMIGGADGPLERRDPVQVPAFVAEESTTRDQPRTRPRRQLTRLRGVQPGPRLGRPPRRRRTHRGGRQQQPPRQGRRQPRRRLRRRPGWPAQRLRDPLRPRPGRSTAPDEPGPRLDARPQPPQPARRQRPVAGGPPGRPRHDHPGFRRGRARSGRLGRRRGPHRDPVRRRGPCAADRGRRRPGLDGDPGRQAADPQDGRRLGPGLRTARGGRPSGPHLRRPDHTHRVDLGAGRAPRGPGGHGAAGPPPGDRRRPARGGGARRRSRAGRRRGPPRPQAARRVPGRSGGRRRGARGRRPPRRPRSVADRGPGRGPGRERGGVHPRTAVRRPVRRDPPGARPAGSHRRLCGGPAAAVRRVRAVGRAAAAGRRLLHAVPAGPVRPATATAAGATTAATAERRLPGIRRPGPLHAGHVQRPGHVRRPGHVQRPWRVQRPGHVRRAGYVQRPRRVRRVRPVRRRAVPAAPLHRPRPAPRRERRTDRPPAPGQAPWQTGNASRGESE